jgi:hypothetical protein
VESAVLYRVIQEKTSMFWEVIVSASVRKNGSYEPVAYPGILFGGGSTNSVEDRDNGDLGAVAP